MSELTPFTQNDFMDSLRARLKETIFQLMPDEALDQLIQKEIDHFFNPRPVPAYSYSNEPKVLPSPFSELVQNLLNENVKAKVQEFFQSDEYHQKWANEGTPKVKETIERVLVENSGQILVSMLSQSFQGALYQMQAQFNQHFNR
jgi:ABC-type amino acid transport substrate-binding protein